MFFLSEAFKFCTFDRSFEELYTKFYFGIKREIKTFKFFMWDFRRNFELKLFHTRKGIAFHGSMRVLFFTPEYCAKQKPSYETTRKLLFFSSLELSNSSIFSCVLTISICLRELFSSHCTSPWSPKNKKDTCVWHKEHRKSMH